MDCGKRSMGVGAVVGIPDEPLEEILSRLPAKSLCRSKCVSKAWRNLITECLGRNPLEGFFYGCVDELGFLRVDNESDHEGGSEDEDDLEGGSEDEEDDLEGGGEDEEDDLEGGGEHEEEGGGMDDEKGSGKDENLPRHAHGHFISLSGRPVPLIDDPSFSFLRKHLGIEKITLLDSCNGLLLFAHTGDQHKFETPAGILRHCTAPGYIVCNPATEHWVDVPSSSLFQSTSFKQSLLEDGDSDHFWQIYVEPYLLFDPAISSHFQLIEFSFNLHGLMVHTYSFETRRWCRQMRDTQWISWDYLADNITQRRRSTFFKGFLHVLVSPNPRNGPELIAAINGEGETSRVISWFENGGFPIFVGQSQKLLHCISSNEANTELSIWILKDYDYSDKWSLKHTVSLLELFGRETCLRYDYNVGTIHPEKNMVFLVQNWDYNLISHDMDQKKVGTLCNVGCDYGCITPYFPYFSMSPVLSKNLPC